MKKNDNKNNGVFLLIQFIQLLVLLLLKWNKIEMGNILYIALLVVLLFLSAVVFFINYSDTQNMISFAMFIILVCISLNNFDYYRVSYNYNKRKKLYNYVVENIDKFEKEEDSSNILLGKYSNLSRDGIVLYEDESTILFKVYDDEYLAYSNSEDLLKEYYGEKLESVKRVDDYFYFIVFYS